MPMDVSIVTPEQEVWAGEADFVLATTLDGDVGILPSHAPFLGALGDSRLVVQTPEVQKYVAVHGGFIQVLDNKVTVLTGIAELAEEIDIERAKAAQQRAEAELQQGETEERRAAYVRATTRLRTAGESGILGIG